MSCSICSRWIISGWLHHGKWKAGKTWQHSFIADHIIESTLISSKTGEITYLFPLYRYDSDDGTLVKNENLNPKFRDWINKRYNKKFSPEEILGCIYAILHSPRYRTRYVDFLKSDFPRIPFPESGDEFIRLSAIGNRLIQIHLLCEYNTAITEAIQLHGGEDIKVTAVKHQGDKLYINKTTYFAPIPADIFNFPIGGYLPLDKYLKSRKGRKLTHDDIDTIKQTTAAITETIALMQQIDSPA